MGPIEQAVDSALGALVLLPQDAGVPAVLRAYASLMDQAQATYVQADRVLRRIGASDTELQDQIRALRSKLSARTAVAELGPKLVAGLAELGATPKSRGKTTTPRHPDGVLASLRAVK